MDIQKTLKVDLHNIPKALAILRAELKRQKEMEKTATPGPWKASALAPAQGKYMLHGSDTYTYVAAFAEWSYDGDLETDMDAEGHNIALSCLSRNLNPARLAVADRMLAGIDDSNPSAEWFVDVAAQLLGVEVV